MHINNIYKYIRRPMLVPDGTFCAWVSSQFVVLGWSLCSGYMIPFSVHGGICADGIIASFRYLGG